MPGVFTVSLDFELYWGVRDKRTLESYRENLLGEYEAIPQMLSMFEQYDIHCTWATVGFLFFESSDDLRRSIPRRRPRYADSSLDPYRCLESIGPTAKDDPFHFAPGLIRKIQRTQHQEIGTHTFSHYYCLEAGQTPETFREDLLAAIEVASRYGVRLTSLAFPRNQFNDTYVAVCQQVGLKVYRGNPDSWIYRARAGSDESRLRRGVRLADSYLNLTGHQVHSPDRLKLQRPFNVPASRFLRPYQPRLAFCDTLRLRRIRDELTAAATQGAIYHLWWHPHNFGKHLPQNMAFLRRILDHYATLRERYHMTSLNMGELADRWALETA